MMLLLPSTATADGRSRSRTVCKPWDSLGAPGHCRHAPLSRRHLASSGPSARRPSSGFDGVNEEANVHANAAETGIPMSVRAL